jgi:hypothetical protein
VVEPEASLPQCSLGRLHEQQGSLFHGAGVTTGSLDKGRVPLVESKELLNVLAPLHFKYKQTVFASVTNNRPLKWAHRVKDVWHCRGNRVRPPRLRQGFDFSQHACVKKH